MIAVGVAGIHTGETPSRLREKLQTFLRDEQPARTQRADEAPSVGLESGFETSSGRPKRY